MRLRLGLFAAVALALLAPRPCIAQERGATALGDALAGLPVSVRVLVIGAHPDDEDTRLITWLGKGRHAQVAYLSLTRGDGGQNLIGNELGEALGVIRTEELLAARRIDGAQQYFARAYDFGFSKSAAETFRHWPHDTLLTDVVTVMRAFRPQIVISVFSGTPRDGHGHHQVAGILAREAYDAAGDGARFPASATAGLPPWTPLKFYRTTSYWQGAGATFHYDAGEYSPLLGRSYAEIAGESRSQHLSQGFGALQRKGYIAGSVRREDNRTASAPKDPNAERSIFDGIDTTYRRLRGEVPAAERARADSLVAALAALRGRFDPWRPSLLVPSLERVGRLARAIAPGSSDDAAASITALRDEAARVEAMAAGIAIEATVARDALALGDSMPATVTVYDQDQPRVTVDSVTLGGSAIAAARSRPKNAAAGARTIVRDSAATFAFVVRGTAVTSPWWLTPPRDGDMFAPPIGAQTAEERAEGTALARVYLADGTVVRAPLVLRIANPAHGEELRPLAVVPAISVALDRAVGYARANAPLDRELRVTLRSAFESPRDVSVRLELPQGLSADTLDRLISLPGMGTQTVGFRVRGTLPAGRHVITAIAESGKHTYEAGYLSISYAHIRPQIIVRPATMEIEAVDAQLPHGVSVAYVQGVGDNIAPMLGELGVPVTVMDAAALASADLSRFTTVVIGTRAYEAEPSLAAQNPRLFDWVSRGGTMVVQYGQREMMQPGMMPYPIVLSSPAARVTDEASPITVLTPNDPLLSVPNRITSADWRGWIQDRALYMPTTFDPRYQTVMATNDPGEPPNASGILRASIGRGSYIYTTLAFFRQLPAGIPGAARLFVNLLSPPIANPAAGARVASP